MSNMVKLPGCWLELQIYATEVRVVLIFLSHSPQEDKSAYFLKCWTSPLSKHILGIAFKKNNKWTLLVSNVLFQYVPLGLFFIKQPQTQSEYGYIRHNMSLWHHICLVSAWVFVGQQDIPATPTSDNLIEDSKWTNGVTALKQRQDMGWRLSLLHHSVIFNDILPLGCMPFVLDGLKHSKDKPFRPVWHMWPLQSWLIPLA